MGRSGATACKPRRIDATYSPQRAEAVPVASSRALWISSGKALAYASACLTSTRGHRKWLAVFLPTWFPRAPRGLPTRRRDGQSSDVRGVKDRVTRRYELRIDRSRDQDGGGAWQHHLAAD